MRLARKIVLALGVVAIFVIAGLETAGVVRDLRIHTADREHDHRMLGETLGAGVAQAWELGGPKEALDLVRVANGSQDELSVRWVWLDSHGVDGPSVPIASVDRAVLLRDRWLSRRFDSPSPGKQLSWKLVRIGDRDGALEISQSLSEQRRLLLHSVLSAAVALAVLAALYLASASILGRRLVGRPIELLTALARRLGEGDLQARARLPHRSELSELADAMHRMADDLAAARARAEREYAAHVETLEHLRHADRLATVGKLAAGVAHEMGTPLNVCAARARMIETGEVEGSESRDSARIIGAQLQSMTSIIRQLLDFARRRRVRRIRVDLVGLVAQAARLLSPLADKKGVEIDTSGVPPLPCDVDPAQMHQVLTNLLMNALHAMQRPGRVLIEASVVRGRPPASPGAAESDWVRVDVRDSGAGIDPDVLPHVFEPFFTTKDVGEGTGLGLSVSWGIVQEHGGWIQVETQPGSGSTFSVFLPGVEVECRAASSL